jgi:hypothetical protein
LLAIERTIAHWILNFSFCLDDLEDRFFMSFLHSLKKIWTSLEETQLQTPPQPPAQTGEPALSPSASQPIAAEPAASPSVLLSENQPRAPYEQQIMEQRSRYTELVDKISKVYNALRGQDAFESPAIDQLLLLCNQAISLRRELLPHLAPGDWIRPHGEAYKRLAMSLEKRGDYWGAAEICLMALRDGAVNDGCQHGMAGRMARMLKRAKASPTPEMRQYLQKKRPAQGEKPLPKAAGGES